MNNRKAVSKELLLIALLIGMCVVTNSGFGQATGTIAIVGGQLVDGNGGPPVHRSIVIIQGKKISAVGREGETQVPAGAKVVDAHGMTVMPGLVEMHAHLIILGMGQYGEWFPWVQRQKNTMEIMKISAHQLLMQGVTTVRDVMSPTTESIQLRDAINAGKVPGPRLFVTGAFISRGCGPAAWHLEPYYCNNVHSPDEAREQTKQRIAAGVDWLKAWSGVTAEDVKAIAEEAHKAGKKVAAHGSNETEILQDIAAPVDSIEHIGSGAWGPLSPELIEKLAHSSHPIWLVPTMMQGWVYKLTEDFPERVDDPQLRQDFPPDLFKMVHTSVEHPERLQYYFANIHSRLKVMPESWRRLINSGAASRIIVGTDTGTPLNWNTNATRNEVKLFVEFGMTPLEAISAATRLPALALGKSDEFGTIVPGKSADILVIDGNPLDDMAYLRNTVHIFKEGVQYK